MRSISAKGPSLHNRQHSNGNSPGGSLVCPRRPGRDGLASSAEHPVELEENDDDETELKEAKEKPNEKKVLYSKSYSDDEDEASRLQRDNNNNIQHKRSASISSADSASRRYATERQASSPSLSQIPPQQPQQSQQQQPQAALVRRWSFRDKSLKQNAVKKEPKSPREPGAQTSNNNQPTQPPSPTTPRTAQQQKEPGMLNREESTIAADFCTNIMYVAPNLQDRCQRLETWMQVKKSPNLNVISNLSFEFNY